MLQSVSRLPSGSSIPFGTIFAVVILCTVLYFGYSIAKDPSAISSIGMSAESKSQLIANKKAELQAYEEGLRQVEAQIE
jgi:sensor histidine kinase regulating citrate/malate metabolism